MSSSVLRMAVENRMKIIRHQEEQRRAPRNENNPPPTPLTPLNGASRIIQIAQGSRDPDTDQGRLHPSQQTSVNNKLPGSPLANPTEKLHKATIAQFAVENYNPPVTRFSQEPSGTSTAFMSSTSTEDTSLDCSDAESGSSIEGTMQNGTSSPAVSRFNPNKLSDILTTMVLDANMPAPKSSPALTIPVFSQDPKEKEEEEQRLEAFYEATSRKLPWGSIYVTYLSRLPLDWQRPLYKCEDDDCTFHYDMDANKTYKFAQERECERSLDVKERRMLAPPKINFHWQLYTHYTVKEASNLHTAVAQNAYPSAVAETPGRKASTWDDETRLWEDESDSSDKNGTEDTGYETDLSNYSNQIAKAPSRVAVTRVTPAIKRKKSIIMQRNQRRKNTQSAVSSDEDLGDNVVFGDDDDDF
ncbi:hypothetical protein BGX38DRAFT_265210 [Terfezia claveryi]|nr:hypothetical protein BGX38DRAFT_265210 [Terfezia claveryi]